MNRRRVYLPPILLLAGLLSFTPPSISSSTQKEAFLGRWDITLANTGDTFRSSWLEVSESEGKLTGKLLWRWGSVTGVKSVEIVGDELRVTRTQSYEDKPVDVVYAAELIGDKLVGSVKNPDGSVHPWTGIRSIEKIDVSGTWEVTVRTQRGPLPTESLVLKQEGPNVLGKYIGGRPQRQFAIQKGKLEEAELSFSVAFRGSGGREIIVRYSAAVHGDKMTGTAQPEGRPAGRQFTAQRQRKWGNPIRVFNGKDLTGWGPRDPAREFHWSVKDGALANRPPDQDIVSQKQFQDFKLHVEFSLARGSNSGIYLRGRYELQLLDDYDYDSQARPPGKHSNCSIYSRIAPSVKASKPANEWQTLDATLVGRWLTVVLNGQTIMDNVHLYGITGGAIVPQSAQLNDESLPGPLTFQGDHGLVRFRKVEVTPALD